MTEAHWYGWETLLVDGASLGVVVGGFWLRPPHQDWSVVSIVGIGGLVLGAPVVHWAHGRAGVGFASLGLRVGLPALGILLAAAIPCSGSECSEQMLGLLLGVSLIPAPIVLDSAWLAREQQTAGAAHSARSVLSLVPFVNAAGGRRMLGVSGRF